MNAIISINSKAVKAAAKVVRNRALVTLSPARKALDSYYGWSDVFDARLDMDLWLLHRAVRQSALSGRINAAQFLNLRDEMTAYKYAELLAWLELNRAQWLTVGCDINMDDIARFLNRNLEGVA